MGHEGPLTIEERISVPESAERLAAHDVCRKFQDMTLEILPELRKSREYTGAADRK